MKTRKLRNLITGEIITVHKSTDHPNSSYGIPVWVDEEGNDYGQAEASVIPCAFGFELLPNEEVFIFSPGQYEEFKAFLQGLNNTNWGTWNPFDWPRYNDMPAYTCSQYIQDNGKTFVVVKFDSLVQLPDGRTGKKFKCGGDKNFRPVCEQF